MIDPWNVLILQAEGLRPGRTMGKLDLVAGGEGCARTIRHQSVRPSPDLQRHVDDKLPLTRYLMPMPMPIPIPIPTPSAANAEIGIGIGMARKALNQLDPSV